jgi:hypothetical protein
MPERTYTVKLRSSVVKVTSRDLAVFKAMYVGTSELSSRMSELILLDMYVYDAEFGVSPHEILAAIDELERGEGVSGVKPATQFKNLPLKGLWHKHFFSARFLAHNIVLGLGKNGLEKLVSEVMDPAKSSIITKEMISELAHRVTNDPLEHRNAGKKLTGEWIIYLKRECKNYYLCCNSHKAGDQFIYNRIFEHCVREFPDLQGWLKDQQNT